MSSKQSASPEELLQRAPLFSRLSRKSLQKLAGLCVPRSYQAGAMIIEEESTGLGMFIVTSGRLEVFKGHGDGRIFLAEMGSGDILGEMALIDDQPRSASAVALEPTECLLITRGSFQTLVRKDTEIAWCIVPTLAERVRELQRKIIEGGIEISRAEEQPEPDQPADTDTADIDTAADTDTADTDTADIDTADIDTADIDTADIDTADTDTAKTKGHREEKTQHDRESKKGRREREDEITRPFLWAMREQYALTMAGFTGLQGSLRCLERFLSSLANETELSSGGSLPSVLRDLPKGLLSAAESALQEGERVPERMLSRYRKDRTWGKRETKQESRKETRRASGTRTGNEGS